MNRLAALPLALLATPAFAAEPNFVPDRPGVGHFPGSPGRGFFMVEGGGELALPASGLTLGTQRVTVRVGLDDNTEIRLRAPDLTLAGDLTVGHLGVGTKMSGYVNDRLGLAFVPELLVPLDGGDVGWRGQTTVTTERGPFRLWTTLDITYLQDLGAFAGLGGLYRFGAGGLFAHGGRQIDGHTMVGLGGIWQLRERVQLDAGCDVLLLDGDVTPVARIGGSGAF